MGGGGGDNNGDGEWRGARGLAEELCVGVGEGDRDGNPGRGRGDGSGVGVGAGGVVGAIEVEAPGRAVSEGVSWGYVQGVY